MYRYPQLLPCNVNVTTQQQASPLYFISFSLGIVSCPIPLCIYNSPVARLFVVSFGSFSLVEARASRLGKKGTFEAVVSNLCQKFCDNADVEEGIAMNEALSENLFVTIVAMLNKLPIMIVGKPGSSKTLALQVILSNLQGAQSGNPFWRKFPSVTLFQYQCSPLSTADGQTRGERGGKGKRGEEERVSVPVLGAQHADVQTRGKE